MLSSAKLFETAQNQLDHNRLFALINSLNDGIMAIDKDGIIRLSNGVALDVLDSNSLEGRSIAEVMSLIDKTGKTIDALELIKSSKSSFTSREYSLRLNPETLISVYISIAPVRAAFGKDSPDGHVIVLRDITREKNREDERDEFISVASHELKTPVTIAEGSLSNALLLAERAHMPDTIITNLNAAHEQMVFLMSLINDLALLSRAEIGRSTLLIEQVRVEDLINDLQNDYRPQAEKKGLGLSVQIKSLPPKLYSSRLYIREILQNLITNAIKYSEKGNINIVVNSEKNATSFQVIDTGIGIDKTELPKLFTKFFRSEDYRVKQISGTGLGLYISAKLANLLSGQIMVTSELDKGSSFTLTIPNSIYHAQPSAEAVA